MSHFNSAYILLATLSHMASFNWRGGWKKLTMNPGIKGKWLVYNPAGSAMGRCGGLIPRTEGRDERRQLLRSQFVGQGLKNNRLHCFLESDVSLCLKIP